MKIKWKKGEAVISIMEKIAGPGFYRGTRAAAEMELLYPGREGQQRIREYYRRKLNRTVLTAVTGIAFFGVLMAFHSADVRQISEIERSAYDGCEKTVTLEAESQDGISGIYEITVSPQIYSEEEAAVRIQEEIDGMNSRILGENSSIDHVSSNLCLPSVIYPGPIKIQWESSDPDILETNGRVHIENISEEGAVVTIKGFLSCMRQKGVYETEVTVSAAEVSAQEHFRSLIEREVSKVNEETMTAGSLILPSTAGNKSVLWSVPDSHTAFKVMILFLLLAAVSYILEDKKFHKELEQRKLQMQADYPDILDKLVLLLGAGMTVRQAWDRITEDYSTHSRRKRYAYEEMILCSRDIKRGTSEQKAYDAFGRRCGGTQYPKLAAILSQNLRKGSNGLIRIFRREAEESFDERRNYARRCAEEAGTKLLMPMFLMLVIMLLIIMIPAYLSVMV